MCLYPIYIRNRKYTPNKKNNYTAPILKDARVGYVAVGCGVCQECRKKRANEWKVRLNEEIKQNKEKALFVTLTFDTEHYRKLYDEIKATNDEQMCTHAIRMFKERVRKANGKAKKMWLIQEYGEDYDRVHLHGLIWGMSEKEVENKWKNGFVYNGNDISERTVNYIIKYCLKTDEKRPNWKPKIWCSPGLGNCYNSSNNTWKKEKTRDIYICKNGAKVGLPMYYRNKIYNDEQREKLWIWKLEKQTRYILGARYRIDCQERIEQWKSSLKGAQTENERLGYGYIPNYWKKKNANTLNINKIEFDLHNTTESCIFAFENKNTKGAVHERSKDKLRDLQMHKTLAKYNNMGYGNNNGNNGSLQKTDVHTWLRLRNNRNTGIGETNGENTDIQTSRNQTTTINNLNNNNNLVQPWDGHHDTSKGYEIVDIDTGEIYTKSEYTRIKNQLKTISYDKKSRKGTRADGTRYTWYETKRFVQKIGKDQLTLFDE